MESIAEQLESLEGLHGADRIDPLLTLAYSLHMRDLPEMRRCLDEARALALEHDHRMGMARYHNINSIYWGVRGNYDRALEEAFASLSLEEEMGETGRAASRLSNIGTIYSRMLDQDNAIRYLELSLEKAEAAGEERTAASALNNLGVAHDRSGNYAEALKYFRRAADLRRGLGDMDQAALALTNVGQLCQKNGDPRKGAEHLGRALGMARESGVSFVEAAASLSLGEVLFELDPEDPEAGHLLDRAVEIAEELEDHDLQMKALKSRSALYENRGLYREALEAFRRFAALQERALAREGRDRIARLEAEYKAEQREKEAEIYRLRNVELAAARDAAEAADRAKSDFLAVMSHEIRTPLNVIMGATQLLERADLPSEQMGLVERSSIASRALLRLISDILDYSRLEAGRMELESVPFCAADLLDETCAMFLRSASKKGISLTCETVEGLPAFRGDPSRLGQVLRNLVSNAIKFTESGTVRVRMRQVGREGDTANVEVTVRDTGVGVDADSVERLFEPFTQGDSSTTRLYGGSGLGLSICARLVQAMGGEISAAPASDGGSVFTVRLPLVVSPRKPGRRKSASRDAEADVSGRRVLLVEDMEANREVCRLFLEYLGVETDEADNGFDALAMLQRGCYDLVLMDIQMPRMDGLSAARSIREKGLDVPVVAMTAHAMPSHRRECAEAGMDDMLTKPFTMEGLRDVLHRWTGRASPRSPRGR